MRSTALWTLAGLCLATCNPPTRRQATPADAPAFEGGGADPNAPARAPTDPSRPYAFMGRFDLKDPNGWRYGRMSWPGSAVGATFEGTGISARLADAGARDGNKKVHNQLDVQIDDGAPTVLRLQGGVSWYPLAEGLSPGPHTVWLRKRTEPWVGSVAFQGFVPQEGNLTGAPGASPRRLEFIGAAAEAGYGATESGARDGCEFSVDTENANLAYPRRVADLLGADYANISYSNKGVYRNLFPQRDSTTLPQLYDRIEPHDGAPWDFTAWQPDAVIIGLGGTDFDALGGSGSKAYRLPPPDEAAFVRAYADFLRLVRAKNPKAAVLCLINPLEDDTHQARSLLKKYLQAALAAVGDPSMLLLELPPYEGDTYGCDNQPDAALHAAMAEQVAAALRDALGW